MTGRVPRGLRASSPFLCCTFLKLYFSSYISQVIFLMLCLSTRTSLSSSHIANEIFNFLEDDLKVIHLQFDADLLNCRGGGTLKRDGCGRVSSCGASWASMSPCYGKFSNKIIAKSDTNPNQFRPIPGVSLCGTPLIWSSESGWLSSDSKLFSFIWLLPLPGYL